MWDLRRLSSGIFFEAITMKDIAFWDMTPCDSSKNNRRFRRVHCRHLLNNKTLFPARSEKAEESRLQSYIVFLYGEANQDIRLSNGPTTITPR
jgi:hypothetical protein